MKGMDGGVGLVLGHCDLLNGNVIILPESGSETEKKIHLIDYEYAGRCFWDAKMLTWLDTLLLASAPSISPTTFPNGVVSNASMSGYQPAPPDESSSEFT